MATTTSETTIRGLLDSEIGRIGSATTLWTPGHPASVIVRWAEAGNILDPALSVQLRGKVTGWSVRTPVARQLPRYANADVRGVEDAVLAAAWRYGGSYLERTYFRPSDRQPNISDLSVWGVNKYQLHDSPLISGDPPTPKTVADAIYNGHWVWTWNTPLVAGNNPLGRALEKCNIGLRRTMDPAIGKDGMRSGVFPGWQMDDDLTQIIRRYDTECTTDALLAILHLPLRRGITDWAENINTGRAWAVTGDDRRHEWTYDWRASK